jgi:hypothetical protein
MSALVAAGILVGQDEPFTIGVSVDSVTVDAIVHDRNGRLRTDLKQGDFEILENGILQSIDYFAVNGFAPQHFVVV